MIKIVASVAVVILGLISAASYVAWIYPLELLSHFRFQYLGLSLLLVLILLMLQQYGIFAQRKLIIVAFLIVGLNAIDILPWFLPHEQQLRQGQSQIRLESFNVYGRNTEYQSTIDLILADQPNVALFIEVDHDSKWCPALKMGLKNTFPYSFCSPGGGLAIFSDRPLQNAQAINLDGVGHHVVTDLEVNDQHIHLIGTHPFVPVRFSTFRQRNLQLSALEKYINQQQYPTVIMGDFNLSPWSPYYRKFVRVTGLYNTRLGFGTLPSWPYPTSFKTVMPVWLMFLMRIPIDHCFVSREFRVVNTRISGHANSDHAAIVADLVVR